MTNLIKIYAVDSVRLLYLQLKELVKEKKMVPTFTAFTKDFRFFIITSTSVTDFGVHLLIVKIFYCLKDPNSILTNSKTKSEKKSRCS